MDKKDENASRIATGFVKTDGFEKSVVFFMSLLEQIWQILQKHKSFRMELNYDAEALNTYYYFFESTGKYGLDGRIQEVPESQD